MRAGACLAAVFATTAVLAVPATAQRIRQPAVAVGPQEVARRMARYGDCVVARDLATARAAVVGQTANDDFATTYPSLFSASCADGSADASRLRFPGNTFRYMLADAIVRVRYREPGPLDFSSIPPLAHRAVDVESEEVVAAMSRRQRQEYTDELARDRLFFAMNQLGECVARANPEGVRSLAALAPYSPTEGRALQALVPQLRGCVDAGAAVEIVREHFRGATLVAYVRLVDGVSVGTTSPSPAGR